MGRRMEVMEREDSEAAFLVDIARISVDLRETFSDSQMFQDGFDEENVCIAHYPQITPEKHHRQLHFWTTEPPRTDNSIRNITLNCELLL